MPRVLDAILRYGVMLLLIWTPLAFGSVHAWAFGLLTIHILLLVSAWMVQLSNARHLTVLPYRLPLGMLFSPLALPLALFLTLVLLQLLPLPPAVLRWLSPTTYDLYTVALPGWPDLATSAATVVPSTWRPLSLYPYATALELVKFLAYAGLFFLLINILRTHRRIRFVCWVIISVATAMAVLGIVQNLSGTTAIYWLRDTSYAGFFGPFINRNHFAGYQTMAILLGLGLLFARSNRSPAATPQTWRQRVLRWLVIFTQDRSLLVFAVAMMTGALFFSLSRGGVLSFSLGLLCFGDLLLIRRGGRGREVWIITLTAMVAVVLWLGITPLLLRLEELIYGSNSTDWAGRWPVFQGTWEMVKDFPLFGVGLQAFAVIFPHYQPPGLDVQYLHVHNDFLQLLAETGGVGFVLLVGGVVLLSGDALRRWRQRHDPLLRVLVPACLAAILAIGTHSLVDFNLHIPANALLLTVVLALMHACVRLPSYRNVLQHAVATRAGTPSPRLQTAVIPWLVMVMALGLCYASLRVVLADLHYPQQRILLSNHWVYQGDSALRRQRLQQALAWTPSHPHYWRALGALEVHTARQYLQHTTSAATQRLATTTLRRAAAAYRRALEGQPTDPYTQLGYLIAQHDIAALGTAEPFLSLQEAAALAARIAILAPTTAQLQYDLGVVLLAWETSQPPNATHQAQRGTAALPFLRRVLQLDTAFYPRVLRAYHSSLPQTTALARFASTIPNTPQGYLKAAQALEPGFWLQARLYYRVALTLAPTDPAILRTYATALQHHGEFAVAQELWQQLVHLLPDEAAAYVGLAEAYTGLDDQQGLVQTLQQLVRHFPRQSAYHHRLAEAYIRLGQTTRAEAVWQQLVTILPHDATGYANLARLYASQHDETAALTMMQQAVKRAPGNPAHYRYLAQLYTQHGDRAQAMRTMERLADLAPGDAAVCYQLGEYFRQEGEYLQALRYYRRALQLRPNQQTYRQAVERLGKQGKKEEGR